MCLLKSSDLRNDKQSKRGKKTLYSCRMMSCSSFVKSKMAAICSSDNMNSAPEKTRQINVKHSANTIC